MKNLIYINDDGVHLLSFLAVFLLVAIPYTLYLIIKAGDEEKCKWCRARGKDNDGACTNCGAYANNGYNNTY